jgi:hypothetical protein
MRPWSAFPPSLEQAVDRFLAGSDRAEDFLFDENAPPHPLKPTTIRTQKTHVRCAASALVRPGLSASDLAGLADVCSPTAFRVAITTIVEMRGGRIGGYVMGLAWTLVKLARFSGALPQNEALQAARGQARWRAPNRRASRRSAARPAR